MTCSHCSNRSSQFIEVIRTEKDKSRTALSLTALRLCSPLAGGHLVAFFEFACEVLAAGKASVHGDGGHRSVGFFDQAACSMCQPTTVQIIDRAGVGHFVAVMREFGAPDSALLRHFIERPFGHQHTRVALELL